MPRPLRLLIILLLFKIQAASAQPYSDTTVIRFDYKQSALYYAFTFEAIDSVVDIMLKNKAVTLSIDGYAYKDEGSDTICYYLSLNRALFVQTYVLGRGIDSSRILSLTAWGKRRQSYVNKDKEGHFVNCRAEIILNYPSRPKIISLTDRDEDGITDNEDACPDVFGLPEHKGCPNPNAVVVPFATQENSLNGMTYKVLDSVVGVLKENPAYTIGIEGHAYKGEAVNTVCERLAGERAEIVRMYLISRQLNPARITYMKNYSNRRPVNAGKTPLDVLLNARAEIIFKKD
ncbi:MAG TPA: OmpA family protein [Ferruginibacter sp.]|jgi:outer membrane protein OmpA-like peptidoglycan-associated protein|nr:OmpA family protein [Ferruginibacter sp.]